MSEHEQTFRITHEGSSGGWNGYAFTYAERELGREIRRLHQILGHVAPNTALRLYDEGFRVNDGPLIPWKDAP